jgi:LEA14-like dessication related protein
MSELLCKAKQFLVEKVANVKTPEATVTDVDLEGVHRDSIDYGAKVSVDNPYEAAIPICEISYVLKSDGRSVISNVSLHGPNRFILSLKKYCNLVLFFN